MKRLDDIERRHTLQQRDSKLLPAEDGYYVPEDIAYLLRVARAGHDVVDAFTTEDAVEPTLDRVAALMEAFES